MIAWFVIGIATLAIFTVFALNAAGNISATTDLASRIETVQHMNSAVNSLLSQARSPNTTGVSYLPAGRAQGGVYMLPANLDQFARTGSGQPIVYCPFGGSESGVGLTVPSANGSSYAIQTASFDGNDYVVGGRPGYAQVGTNPNLLGWLIAPRSRNDPTPSCDQVSYDSAGNKFVASGAIVRPIIRDIGDDQIREIATRETIFYVSPSGGGNGASSNEPTTLLSALDFWRTRQPPAMRIRMASGNYTLPNSYLDINSGSFYDRGTDGTLTFEGLSSGVAINFATYSNIRIPANLDIYNVAFSPVSRIYAENGHTLHIINSSTGGLFAMSGGRVVVQNSTINANGTHGIQSNQGSATLLGTNTININTANYAILGINSGSTTINSSSLTINNLSGNGSLNAIVIAPSAYLTIDSSAISFISSYSSAFTIQGALIANQSTFGMTGNIIDGIRASDGSFVSLSNGQISGSPATGFADYGAGKIAGTNFLLRGNVQCWWRNSTAPLLTQSASSASGAVTSVLADVTVPALTTNTNTAISNYAAAQQTNMLRSALRPSNTSVWTCG